jgi:hypothetical protein
MPSSAALAGARRRNSRSKVIYVRALTTAL